MFVAAWGVRENGLKLNRAKCHIGVQEITFLGDKLSSQGIEADERKIKPAFILTLRRIKPAFILTLSRTPHHFRLVLVMPGT